MMTYFSTKTKARLHLISQGFTFVETRKTKALDGSNGVMVRDIYTHDDRGIDASLTKHPFRYSVTIFD